MSQTAGVPQTATIGDFVETLDREPWDYLARVEELGGVVWDASMQAYLVSGHKLLKELARDDNALWRHVLQPGSDGSHSMGLTYDQLIAVEGGSARTLFLIDGGPHKRLHRWWVEALSPGVLESVFETILKPTVREELDRVARRPCGCTPRSPSAIGSRARTPSSAACRSRRDRRSSRSAPARIVTSRDTDLPRQST